MQRSGPYVFLHGSLCGSTLLEDLLLTHDSSDSELSIYDPRSSAL